MINNTGRVTRHDARPAKLRSGAWGARIVQSGASAKPGQTVHIRARNGKAWNAIIDRVVWVDGNAAIVATR